MAYDPRALGARCDLCPLRGNQVVPPTVVSNPQLVIVGEGPGRVEEKMGAPFMGASGKFLDERLRKDAKTPRNQIHITNAALCRGESDDDNERAAECCAPRLLNELRDLPSNAPTVLLGKAALRSVVGANSILTARGFIWTVPEVETLKIRAAYKKDILRGDTLKARSLLAGRVMLPTLHPAFVLRADVWKPVIEVDFRRIGKVFRKEIQPPWEDEVDYQAGGPEVLSQLSGSVSLDIETDGIKPLECNILSIGLADKQGHVSEIWPWSDDYSKALSKDMGPRPEVVFHNGHNFDLLVLENHGVVW